MAIELDAESLAFKALMLVGERKYVFAEQTPEVIMYVLHDKRYSATSEVIDEASERVKLGMRQLSEAISRGEIGRC